ncbi:MAG: DUF3048 domain-containing protein [Clostridia bacterium]|nr:DUF3048 domain-containing protein [Clostridia bacterium]
MKARHLRRLIALAAALCLIFCACGTKEAPAVEEPVTDAPETQATEVPAETDPAPDVPSETQAETVKQETEKPETEKPETEKPETEKPETEKTETEKPETEKTETEKPETEKPDEEDKDGKTDTGDKEKDNKEKEDKDNKDDKDKDDKDKDDKDKDDKDSKDDKDDTDKDKKEEEPRIYNYLNGETCTLAEQQRRPVAIMLNNLKLQLPQYSLDYGQIYYECVTEGQIPRLMMLVDDYENIGTVGSIRSSRDYFATWVNDYDAIYVHAGGSPQAYETIAALGLSNLDGANMYLPSTYFRDTWRMNNIGSEHSLMTNGAGIVSGIKFKGYRTKLKDGYEPIFLFNEEDTKPAGSAATHVRMYSTSIQTVDFVYDSTTKEYLRYQYNGIAHVDGLTSNQISVKNVIILFTDINPIPGDPAARVSVVKVGSGTGYYITDGRRTSINWSRENESAPLKLTTAKGEPLALNIGKTFINVVDDSVEKSINFNYKW